MNELEIFKSKEFGEIRTLCINNEPWFVGKDLVEKLGYDLSDNSYTKYVKQFCDKEDRIMLDKTQYQNGVEFNYKKLGQRGGWIINENGLYRLIANSKTMSEYKKKSLVKLLNLDCDKFIVSQRKEIQFLDKIEQVFKPFNIKGIKQYKILNYRIDYYIPELNIAIEYDENNHKHYTYEQQELRQKLIEKELGCRFVRVSDKDDDEYNIGQVIKEIFEIKGVA